MEEDPGKLSTQDEDEEDDERSVLAEVAMGLSRPKLRPETPESEGGDLMGNSAILKTVERAVKQMYRIRAEM